MTQVPVKVATAELGSTRPMESMAGKTVTGRDKIREERNREGRTFADVMKKTGKGDSSAENTGRKTESGVRRKSRDSIRPEFKPFSGADRNSDNTVLLKSGLQIQNPVRESGKNPDKSAKRTGSPQEYRSLSPEQISEVLKLGSDIPTPLVKGTDTIRRAAPGKTDNSSGSGEVSAKRVDGGLTGTAPRIEVVDNRIKTGGFERFRESGIREQAGKGAAREPGTRKSDGSGFTVKDNAGNAVFKSDSSFALAETDIELNSRSEGKTGQRSAAAELSRKLDAQAGNDIVRQVKVVLNRANTGEVRINLRPDNLGRVSVRINLEDNRLTGRIFVETAAAREAFRAALDGLQARLVESGFGAADLELAWDESGNQFNRERGQSGNRSGKMKEALQEFENTVPTTVSGTNADSRVNMVV